jgi:adenylyl cyclase-associated protein
VETLVSAVDVVKSSNFALQVLGTIPTVLLDQVDGAQVYLPPPSAGARIFMSKTANVNLMVIKGGSGSGSEEDEEADRDYVELALPSQICSYYDKAKGEVVNEIVDHAG